MVTGWAAGGGLEVTGPGGRETLTPRAVVLATGCRERPRAARLVPGTRPAGVMTTGTLQQLVHLGGRRVGTRAVVVGAEHVSFSAVATLAEGGARTVAMVTEHPRHASFAAARLGVAARYRAPLHTRTAITAIHGRERVEAVSLRRLDDGSHRPRRVRHRRLHRPTGSPTTSSPCSAASHSIPAPAARSSTPRCARTASACSPPATCDHGAEAADVAALAGRHAGERAAAYLRGAALWPARRVPVRCAEPLHWIAPNAIAPDAGEPPRHRFLLRAHAFLERPEILAAQDGRALWRGRLRRVGPGRSSAFPAAWTADVDPGGGPVELRVVRARPVAGARN